MRDADHSILRQSEAEPLLPVQIDARPSLLDDDIRRLMFGVLDRAVLDFEEAIDRARGLRPSFGQAHEFSNLSEITSWFFDDEFFVWHELTREEKRLSDAAGIFFEECAASPRGFATLEQSDGIFSFRSICDYLQLNIDGARAALRRWIASRQAGGNAPLLSPRWRTPSRDWTQARGKRLAPRFPERNDEIARRLEEGLSEREVARAMGLSDTCVRGVVRSHLSPERRAYIQQRRLQRHTKNGACGNNRQEVGPGSLAFDPRSRNQMIF